MKVQLLKKREKNLTYKERKNNQVKKIICCQEKKKMLWVYQIFVFWPKLFIPIFEVKNDFWFFFKFLYAGLCVLIAPAKRGGGRRRQSSQVHKFRLPTSFWGFSIKLGERVGGKLKHWPVAVFSSYAPG